jgi:hypothetical protein
MKPQHQPPRYYYTRDRDGCDDVFLVWDDAGRELASLPFWDSVEGEEAEAEEEARRIVRSLNQHRPSHVRAYDDVA